MVKAAAPRTKRLTLAPGYQDPRRPRQLLSLCLRRARRAADPQCGARARPVEGPARPRDVCPPGSPAAAGRRPAAARGNAPRSPRVYRDARDTGLRPPTRCRGVAPDRVGTREQSSLRSSDTRRTDRLNGCSYPLVGADQTVGPTNQKVGRGARCCDGQHGAVALMRFRSLTSLSFASPARTWSDRAHEHNEDSPPPFDPRSGRAHRCSPADGQEMDLRWSAARSQGRSSARRDRGG